MSFPFKIDDDSDPDMESFVEKNVICHLLTRICNCFYKALHITGS